MKYLNLFTLTVCTHLIFKIQYLNSPSAKPFAQTSRSAFSLAVFLWTVPTHGTHQLLYQIFSVTCEWITYDLAVQEITQ